MEDVRITTTDNPYDPFTQPDEWNAFDESKGYHTLSYLDRLMAFSDADSDEEVDEVRIAAINEIVMLNLTGNYKKVYN